MSAAIGSRGTAPPRAGRGHAPARRNPAPPRPDSLTASAASAPRIGTRTAPSSGIPSPPRTPRPAPCAAPAANGARPGGHGVSSLAATQPPTGPAASAAGPLSKGETFAAHLARRRAAKDAKVEALRVAVAAGRTVAAAARRLGIDEKYAGVLAAQYGIKADPAVLRGVQIGMADKSAHAKIARTIARIRAAIEAGARGAYAIAEHVGLSDTHVRKVCFERGIDIPPPLPAARKQHPLADKMRALVAAGHTIKEASRRLDLSPNTGQKIARREGITSSREAQVRARRPPTAPPQRKPNPHRTAAQNANAAQLKRSMWAASRSPAPPPTQAEADAAIRAYLDRGGAITQCPPGAGYVQIETYTVRGKGGITSGGWV